jgi:hypothetical protein
LGGLCPKRSQGNKARKPWSNDLIEIGFAITGAAEKMVGHEVRIRGGVKTEARAPNMLPFPAMLSYA